MSGHLEGEAAFGQLNKQERRFAPSTEEFSKKRLEGLKDTVAELRSTDPAILSFTMFGSMARGNPRPESDIDGYLFVDEKQLGAAHPDQVITEEKKDESGTETYLSPELSVQYRQKFKEMMSEKTDMAQEQIDTGLKIRPISERIIQHDVQSLVQHFRDKEKYNENFNTWLKSEPPDRTDLKALIEYQKSRPEAPSTVSPSTALSGMFHLDVGGGVRPYREFLIDELEQQGADGEEAWQRIIQGTEMLENYLSTTDKRYPRTLAEARKVYGKEKQ